MSSLMVFVFPTVGLMMIGLGLLKTGFLNGARSVRMYWSVVAAGAVALAIVAGLAGLDDLAHVRTLWSAGWRACSTPDRPGLRLGADPDLEGGSRGPARPLAAAGRMALTNYLAQSILMTSLFYGGRGLGLMGQVDRPMLWLIVIGVWALQLVWSPLWLRRFRMGPAEWGWRCLTQGGGCRFENQADDALSQARTD